MIERPSRTIALVGLVTLAAILLANGLRATTLIGAAPLLGLAFAGLLPWPRWAIATAVFMLPYFSYGVTETITSATGRGPAVAFTLLTVAVLLAAFDDSRRSRT